MPPMMVAACIITIRPSVPPIAVGRLVRGDDHDPARLIRPGFEAARPHHVCGARPFSRHLRYATRENLKTRLLCGAIA